MFGLHQSAAKLYLNGGYFKHIYFKFPGMTNQQISAQEQKCIKVYNVISLPSLTAKTSLNVHELHLLKLVQKCFVIFEAKLKLLCANKTDNWTFIH